MLTLYIVYICDLKFWTQIVGKWGSVQTDVARYIFFAKKITEQMKEKIAATITNAMFIWQLVLPKLFPYKTFSKSEALHI